MAREWSSQRTERSERGGGSSQDRRPVREGVAAGYGQPPETAEEVQQAQRGQLWTLATVASVSAILAAALSIGLWLWLAPAPEVPNQLDAKAVAEHLKPAIVDALKRR